VRLQLSMPTEHPAVVGWPLTTPLAEWHLEGMHHVLGLHRHEVRLVEDGQVSYVVKELPDPLAEREFRLLRILREEGLPTAEVVAVATDRGTELDGLLVTRFLDYSLPYRSLLSGRGLQIPYLGDRLLDALAGLLIRLHLAGFYWGDCSLSNTLFLRDAGALSAYIIDVETSEHHESLSEGQRLLDLSIAVENLAGGLLDLQAAGRLAEGIDPLETAEAMERSYHSLWTHLTGVDEFDVDETFRVAKRLERLHELGFDASEMELQSTADGSRLRLIPRVVEHGYHTQRLASLTGLHGGENQARALLDDIHRYGAVLEQRNGRKMRESTVADTWLEERFEPTMASIPAALVGKLAPAELYHQVLEHRWLLSEQAGHDVGLHEAIDSYIGLLADVPDEAFTLDTPSLLLPLIDPAAPPPGAS
jgi:Domain of unknown function (DUF4032)/Lipopolysaccharide kinase (Kdo/WaaP) family